MSSAPLVTIQPPGPVLPTLNSDGSRRWIRPKPSRGRYWARRRVVAYGLMLVFFAIPYLDFQGQPLFLLDIPHRRFTMLGFTLLATDALPFMLLFLSLLLTIVIVTAFFGRLWCGWGCPQTVYMEFLFRPVERWLEGGQLGSQRLDRARGIHPRRLLKHGLYALFAAFLAHTFLAYFVPVEELAHWVTRSPVEHPTEFLVMLGTTALVWFDFGWFREQTCMVVCPYGRLQSVLLDRRSIVVGYDRHRGEPRGKGTRARAAGAGDCIDCGLCVTTCPTGIDIRDGLQMECIHCTQCVDACNGVMRKIGKPEGLIRYSTRDALEGRTSHGARPRVILYPIALAVTAGLFFFLLGRHAEPEVTLLRGIGAPYQLTADGTVTNQVRIKIQNRAGAPHRYTIGLEGLAGARLVAPFNPLPVAAGDAQTTSVFVVIPRSAFAGEDEASVTFRVSDGEGFEHAFSYRVVGPEEEEHH